MYPKPKKSLGQNFLVDKNIQRKIIAACKFGASDCVLEIGAGRGDFTALIADTGARVYALEIDRSLCRILSQKFDRCTNITIACHDILTYDIARHFSSFSKIKVFGNIPYYISSPIIEHLIEYRNKIQEVYLTVQEEYGDRMIAKARSDEYSSLSCFVQYYCQPEILFGIKRGSFVPAPKVDSSFLRLGMRRTLPVDKETEVYLFTIIRSAFGKRRKTLRNSLDGVVAPEKLEQFFALRNLDVNTRPERLGLDDFMVLARL